MIRAYITGGSKGIGYGIARALLRIDGQVAITARSLSSAESAAQSLIEETGNNQVLALASDVTQMEEERKAVAATIDKWGGIDLVVANAGVGVFGAIDQISDEDWHRVIDTNLTGAFQTLRASVDALKESMGFYITISSLAGTNFFENGAAYNASKFGLTGFTQAVMLDLRRHGIRVSTIMPGSVATYFNDHTPGPEDDWKIQIEDIGQMVVDLVKLNPRTLPARLRCVRVVRQVQDKELLI